jgi:hypothetical protein
LILRLVGRKVGREVHSRKRMARKWCSQRVRRMSVRDQAIALVVVNHFGNTVSPCFFLVSVALVEQPSVAAQFLISNLPLPESQPLIGFACGHVYHFPHLLHHRHNPSSPSTTTRRPSSLPTPPPEPSNTTDDEIDELGLDLASSSQPFTRSVGAKVTNARLLKMKVDDVGGCWVCRERGGGGGGGGDGVGR